LISHAPAPRRIRAAAWPSAPRLAPQFRSRLTCEGLENRTHLSVSTDAKGFTVVTPSIDSQIIYVSTSGNDNNGGLDTAHPVATITKARTLVRDHMPDEILLRRGDTFYNQSFSSWNLSGRSPSEPFLIGAYTDPSAPSSQRPKVATGWVNGIGFATAAPLSDIYVLGVSFEANTRNYRDPGTGGTTFTTSYRDDAIGGTYGLRVLGPLDNLLVEDCSFQYFRTNITLQATTNSAGQLRPVTNVKIRRNQIIDAYSPDIDENGVQVLITSEGIYAEGINGLTIDGNVLDHNGWAENNALGGSATQWNHNIYINSGNTNVVVSNNVIADAGAHGLQMRAGGIVTNNVFLRNPIGMSFGFVNGTGTPGGVSGEISNNVFLEDRDIAGAKRGYALELANLKPASQGGGTLVRNNIFASDTQNSFATIRLDVPTSLDNPQEQVGINDLTLDGNLLYSWYRGISINNKYVVGGGVQVFGLNGLVVRNNDIQRQFTGSIVDHAPAFKPGLETWVNNRYDSSVSDSSSAWFKVGSSQVNAATWQSVYEPTAMLGQGAFPDPTRGVGKYNGTLGGGTTTDAFLAEARRQSGAFWRTNYTTDPVIDYIRAGFTGGKIDIAGPTASAVAANISIAGAPTQTVTVTYSDDNKLNLASLGNGDIRVLGPNGYSAAATLVSSTGPGDGSRRTATYTVLAPNGQGWNASSNGLYSVVLQNGEVLDVTGKSAGGDTIGSFSVAIDPATPSAAVSASSIGVDTAPATVTVTYTGAGTPSLPVSVAPANAGFETPNVGSDDFFAYQGVPANAGWSWGGTAGISGNNSGYTGGIASSPQGAQVAYLQGSGSIMAQTIDNWTAATYTISFQAAQRITYNPAVQDVQVSIDGQLVGTFTPASDGAYHLMTSAPFAVAAGSHYLAIVGLNSASGDNTAFIDDIQITGMTAGGQQTLSAASLDTGDIRLSGPNSYVGVPSSATPDSAGDGAQRIVTYVFPAPAGGWSSIGSGSYAVNSVGGQVLTTSAAAVPAGKIGTLNVSINAPTATVQAGNVSAGSSGAQAFTVTYIDDSGINAASIDPADIRVTGPAGFNSGVALIGTNGGAGTAASPLVVTYTVAAPGAGWTSVGNGTYWITAQANQVIDGDGNALPAGAIGSFRVAIDVTAPVNWNLEQDITNPAPLGGSSPTKTVGVSYYDVSGINISTLDNNDIHILGPNGYDQVLVKGQTFTSATSAFVNYTMQPPVGGWKSSYNGTYSVVLMPGAVSDTLGNSITSPRTISTFQVALETTPPTVQVSVSPSLRNTAVGSIGINFSETVTGFDLSDLTLTRNGVVISLAGASLSTGDNINYTLGNLSGLTGVAGNYVLGVAGGSSGVVDLAGNAMVSGASAGWTLDLTPPSASATTPSITQPSLVSQTITVSYSDALGLNLGTVDSSDIYVTGAGSYFAFGTLISSSGSSTSRTVVYSIPAPSGGWKNTSNGTYTITLQSGQVADSAGNFAAGGTMGSFAVSIETIPPTVTVGPVPQPPRGVPVASVSITFSEPVTGLDVSDLSLTRDGVAVSPAGATIGVVDSAHYTLSNLSAITAQPGNYTLTLNAAGSGIADLAGNALAAGAATSFTVTPPVASFNNYGFELPALGAGGYFYRPDGTAWAFWGNSGVTANFSAFTSANVPAPEGTQVAFLQMTGFATQTLNGVDAGSYVISLQASQRNNYHEASQVMNVQVDGVSVGTFTPTIDADYHSFTTFPIALSEGSHTVTIAGLNPSGGDNTIFVDDVHFLASVTPALAAQVGPVSSPQTTPVDAVPISFNRTVSGFDLSDVSLTRDGAAVPLDGATLTTSDGQIYSLAGLSAATTPAGVYVLGLNAAGSGITDTQGTPLFSNASGTWTTQPPIPAPSIAGVTPNPVAGSPFLQDLTISGASFVADDIVTLGNLTTGGVITNATVISRSASQIIVRAAFGGSAANWTAQVSGSTGASNQSSFSVSSQTPISVSMTRSSAGKSVSLNVLNAVGAGLTFSWSTTAGPSGAPAAIFTDTATTTARNTTANFSQAGNYTLNVQISDGVNFVNVPVSVAMTQQLTAVGVTPSAASVANSKTQQLKAQTLDQFGLPMASQPASFTWSKTSGIGTISSTGLYTAPSSGTGTAVIKAASGSLSATATMTVQAAFTSLWVDFVPASASVVSGYQRDGGSVYGSRGNGFTYGWNVSHTDTVFDRNKTSNQIVDTSIGIKTGGKWEVAVPNGTYSVLVGVGDSSISTTNTVRVEGTTALSAVKLNANTYTTKTVTVTVTDGKITIDAGSAANLATRLTYLKITKV
jgi:hypothetical protein